MSVHKEDCGSSQILSSLLIVENGCREVASQSRAIFPRPTTLPDGVIWLISSSGKLVEKCMSHLAKVVKKMCLFCAHFPFWWLHTDDSEAWRKMEHKIKESWVSESLHGGKLAPDKELWHSAVPWARHQFYHVQPLKSVGAFVIAVYSLGFSRKTESIWCVYLSIHWDLF